MSRRGRQKAWISLFAFQDIITAVSGILIVTVLLMTLDLMANPQSTAARVEKENVSLLQQAIQELTDRRDALDGEINRQEDLVEQAASIPVDVLIEERNSAEHETKRLEAEVFALQKRLKLNEELLQQAEARRFDSKETEQTIAEKRREMDQLKQSVERNAKQRRVFYELPRGVKKDGWLVVVSDNSISAAPLTRAARPIDFRPGKLVGFDVGSPVKAFVDWIRKQGNSGEIYVMVLVRPSGVEQWDELEPELTKLRVEYGFDLISPGQVALNPETGARD